MSQPMQPPVSHLRGYGTAGLDLLPQILDACQQLEVLSGIGSAGVAEFNIKTLSEKPPNIARWGIPDTSVTLKELQHAGGNDSSAELSLKNAAGQTAFTHLSIDRMSDQVRRYQVVDPVVLSVSGMVSGHFRQFQEGLKRTHDNTPDVTTIGWGVLPHEPYKRPLVPRRIGHFITWQREYDLLGTYVTDNDSPLVRAGGFTLPVQDRCCTRTFAGLLGGQHHVLNNPSMREATRELTKESPFIGMSFASGRLAVLPHSSIDGRVWAALRHIPGLGSLPERGGGDDDNLLQVAKTVTERAITDPSCRAIDDPIDLRRVCFVVYLVPLSLTQKRRWDRFAAAIRGWLNERAREKNDCPISPIFISGPGVPDPNYPGVPETYWLQASLLYPLPTFPQTVRKIAQEDQTRRERILDGKAGEEQLVALAEELR